jgi:hypothetical protein
MKITLAQLEQFVGEALALAPSIISAVKADVASFGSESKTAAAATALVQASSLAKQVDPGDTDTIAKAQTIASGIITALQTPAA